MSIPLTKLGGKAFSHSDVGNDTEAEYDRLRGLARAEASKRNDCFDRAHKAYERGDGAAAKELSTEGKRHAAQMDAYNRQASEYIFRENNAPGRLSGDGEDSIDLHGQFVEEAEAILEKRIRDARARGQTHLHVIVGRGNHSAGNVQRVKPRVEQLCAALGLRCETEENAGRIYVDLTSGGDGGEAPVAGDGDGDGGAGHGKKPRREHGGQGQGHEGGGRPPQQQRPPQHHQEQQQPGGLENIIGKFVRKLRDSCVVM